MTPVGLCPTTHPSPRTVDFGFVGWPFRRRQGGDKPITLQALRESRDQSELARTKVLKLRVSPNPAHMFVAFAVGMDGILQLTRWLGGYPSEKG